MEPFEDPSAPHAARAYRRLNGSPNGTLKCEQCGAMNASKNRQRTAYHNSDNMATLCPKCQDAADEYWDALWEEIGY